MADLKIVDNKEGMENLTEEKLSWKVNEEVMTDIVPRLYDAKVIAEPQMKFIYDDRGIMDVLFDSHMSEEEVTILRQTKPDTFIMVVAVHSMGAGMMTIFKQKQMGKTLGHFTEEEVADLNNLFKAYDAYQLACEKLDAKPGTGKKKYLDTVASQGVFIAKRTAGDRLLEEEVLRGFAQTMFNLGVTIALG